ncbi:MAG: LON peptidase substrate-binding domain-containing protein [Burkholderiales bacterium]|uniref:LON peptidase substrate-binding domain-containing protein n=1 Tax=Ottowia sp. TaxID=1898956 RepID=UPI001AD1476B|nr:LON peptidase substrate-binding domain-containing protein [Ottowia sp.]MBN9404662.1 LON peptidase substrate-binding domain-containing protein [Burkholderiales bacterium]MBS0404340.1 LON peptidase substrate-binding domain-containing protein [Pseudomonadota bacterium]MBS0415327.1 LON peptidase substrate-binding domain-containing protein [Pseudomonadota bacterium]
MTALTLTALPLFPLDTVLFPDGVLPLQVFEPRYLDMVGRCQRAGAPFGVVALAQGREVRAAGTPPEQLAPIGTLAHIRRLEQPRPGLLLIECVGGDGFRIERSSLLKHGLWVADVSLLARDTPMAVPDDLHPVAEALRRLLADPRAHLQAAGAPASDDDERFDDCGWVANRWCERLPLPTAARQRLLGIDSPLLRLELVADLLERAGIGSGPPSP